MYAVIETGGKQYQVSPEDKIFIELTGHKGEKITFSKVLLIKKDGELKVGNPYIEKASVIGKILGEVKAKKVIVFKKKRRKQYKRTRGHRHRYLEILIKEIKEG